MNIVCIFQITQNILQNRQALMFTTQIYSSFQGFASTFFEKVIAQLFISIGF